MKSQSERGAYQLYIELDSDCWITVGALGKIHFLEGGYIYTGSAMRGISARVARHLRFEKCLHWHIDYLLACKSARIREIHIFPSRERKECHLNKTVRGKTGAQLFAPGFGASDCSQGCGSHLSYVGKFLPH